MVRFGRLPRLVAGVVVAACLAVSLVSVVAMAGTDDRGAAEAALREVDTSPTKDAATEPVARARVALERATRMRAAGDESHARLADSLARAWAEVARDVARAAAVERSAAAAHLGATDAGVIAERERALLEEAIAQSGRLRAQLEAVERGPKEAPTRTSAEAAKIQDGGARPRPTKPAAPKGGAGVGGAAGANMMADAGAP